MKQPRHKKAKHSGGGQGTYNKTHAAGSLTKAQRAAIARRNVAKESGFLGEFAANPAKLAIYTLIVICLCAGMKLLFG